MTLSDDTFAALADPTRRGVIELLCRRPRRAGELAEALGITRPALSKHLRVLRRRGLIAEKRLETDARVRLLRLRHEPLLALQRWLDEVESFRTERLDSSAAHAAERTPRDHP